MIPALVEAHIMNYESTCMSNDEMVEATYDAGARSEPHQGRTRILDPKMAAGVDARIRQAREQMRRLDDVLYNGTGRIDARLASPQRGVLSASPENTVEKSELNGRSTCSTHVGHLAKLWLKKRATNPRRASGKTRPCLLGFRLPDQRRA